MTGYLCSSTDCKKSSYKKRFSLTIEQYTVQDYKLFLALPQTGLVMGELYLPVLESELASWIFAYPTYNMFKSNHSI